MQPERIVAVTGSAGKTTTSRLVSQILASQAPTHASIGHNTASAIAKRIYRARPRHRNWVVEVSGHSPGAINPVAKFITHDAAIVTTVGLDHFKNFRSREAVAAEKSNLVRTLPAHGLAVLNADDPLVAAMAAQTKARVVSYGRAATADIRLVDCAGRFPDPLRLSIDDGAQIVELQSQLVGERWATAILAAFALGRGLGIPAEQCARAIAEAEAVAGRDSVHSYVNGSVILADIYKAPVWSLASGFETVRTAQASRKTIVIGTLSDYGGSARKKYEDAARQALAVADRVIFTGPHSARIRRMIPQYGERLMPFEDLADVANCLQSTAQKDELIYLKGSSKDKMEQLVPDFRAMVSS
nr:Mur ligase family protein [Pseudohoeflea sp. DP4N28-3]